MPSRMPDIRAASPTLASLVEAPHTIFTCDRAAFDALSPAECDDFRLEAARRLVARQAERIPAVAELLDGRDPAQIERLDDLVPLLLAEDAYKSYDPRWLAEQDFAALTRWIGRFTARDYSALDMEGCASLTEWCERILDQTGDLICHSSGTSGTLSFVPRSQTEVDLFTDALMWNYQSPAFGGRRLFRPGEASGYIFFTPAPRRQFRITAGMHKSLERRYLTRVEGLDIFLSPEFAIAQGKLRTAARRGNIEAALADPIVAAHREEVEAHGRAMPALMEAWTRNLIENFQGEKIIFQGTFDMAWQLALHFRSQGIANAFDPDSLFSVIGGVKDGTVLPADWKDQFRESVGVSPSGFRLGWGMSEINGGSRLCAEGKVHFPPHLIPFQLMPGTRQPLPRSGVQRGQIAMMELVSQDNWGGMISGDGAVIDWDSPCACGRPGPLMDPESIGRI